MSIRAEGLTLREIGNELGLSHKQMRDWSYRHNREQRNIALDQLSTPQILPVSVTLQDLWTTVAAAAGKNSSIISLIINLFIGSALGANVTIAHAIGEQNDTVAHDAVPIPIITALIGGVFAAIVGELAAVPLLG